METPEDTRQPRDSFKVARFETKAFSVESREAMGLDNTDIDTWFGISIMVGFDLPKQAVRLYIKLDLSVTKEGSDFDEKNDDQPIVASLSESVAASIRTEMLFREVETYAAEDKEAVNHYTMVEMTREAITATKGAFASRLAGTSYEGVYPPMFDPESLLAELAKSPGSGLAADYSESEPPEEKS